MTTVSIHDAQRRLTHLVQQAASGETVIITRAGKPIAKLTALDVPAVAKRLGFLAGEFQVPRDFDQMGHQAIVALFGHDALGPQAPATVASRGGAS